jgi:hypothetical protein
MHCKPCFHPRRSEIDRQIVVGVAYRNIAAAFDLSLGSLSRHKSHIQEALADAVKQRDGERSEQSSALLARVEKLVGEAESLLASAKAKDNIAGATSAINAATRLLELLGRLTGELGSQNSGGIHLTVNKTTNTTINYNDDTEIAVLIAEATRNFDPNEIQRLRMLAEGQPHL